MGSKKRLGLIAGDMVTHSEGRLGAMGGKATMVCMGRRICVDLYREMVRLRPEWHGGGDGEVAIGVAMTGSPSGHAGWQGHV